MADLDLYNIGKTPDELQKAVKQLRADFDSHNHDGTSSRQFQSISLDSLIAKGVYLNGVRVINCSGVDGIKDISFYNQDANNSLLATISALSDGSLSFAPTGFGSSFYGDIEVAGNIYGAMDGGSDLGTATSAFGDLYLNGTIFTTGLSLSGDLTMGVDKNISLQGNGMVTDGNYSTLVNIFGTGDDGNVVISVTSGLTRDAYYNNLTITSGAALHTNGYRIFVKNTLTIGTGCTISRNGNNGSAGGDASGGSAGTAGNGGTALAAATLPGSYAGTDGAIGVSGNGSNSPSTGTAGNNGGGATASPVAIGGPGADMSSQHGGDGGPAGARSGGTRGVGSVGGGGAFAQNLPTCLIGALMVADFTSVYTPHTGSSPGGGAPSGGSGAHDTNVTGGSSGGSGGGGGGGGCGGIVAVYARLIVMTDFDSITALGGTGGKGGNGGSASGNNGGGGGGCGGCGGTGGVVILVYKLLTGTMSANCVLGGSYGVGGTGGTWGGGGDGNVGYDGQNGVQGATGQLWKYIV